MTKIRDDNNNFYQDEDPSVNGIRNELKMKAGMRTKYNHQLWQGGPGLDIHILYKEIVENRSI